MESYRMTRANYEGLPISFSLIEAAFRYREPAVVLIGIFQPYPWRILRLPFRLGKPSLNICIELKVSRNYVER